MINNEKKVKNSSKWDVWKKFKPSKKKEKTNKDIFIENWQQIQVYYYKGFLNNSKPISQTGIIHNLKQLSKCIILETETLNIEGKIKSYNPDGCLEYFIEKQIAVKLVDYAEKNIPIGMHLEVLKLFESLLSCETIFLNLFPELNFRTSFHKLLFISLNFPRQTTYSSKNLHDTYDDIKNSLVKLISTIFSQLIENPSYISFFYNNKKILKETSSHHDYEFLLSSDVSSQFLIFDILFKLFSDNVKSYSLYDQTVLLGMDLLSKLESIYYSTNQFINQDDFNDIYKTNKRNDMSLLRFSDIVDSHHVTSLEEEILLYVLNKSTLFEIINEQFALLYAATIVNLPSSDNKEIDLHNIMNIYMYQQNISFHPKHSKHILKSYITAIKTKYPILKTNYSYNTNEYNERLLSYWTFINIILERCPKCILYKYLEKFEQYVINSFILLDFQNEEFSLNSTICINDLFCKSNIPKLKELLFLVIWKNQKLVLKRINQTEDKILSFETIKLIYNIISGYDYYIYRYIISNFILENKNIYNLEKYKKKQPEDYSDDEPKEFSDDRTKKYNNFFYNVILNLIKLIPKDVLDTRNEFDLFLFGVENNYFLMHDIKDNQILSNSFIQQKENNEDNCTSHTNSMIQKNEDSISQETLVGNESLFLTPSSSNEKLNNQIGENSNDEFDIIEREEELKVKIKHDFYSICPTKIYVKESYERIRNCTKIMMTWNEITENKNENEIDKFMLLSSEININFCKELIRSLENFFRYDYEHNVLLTGCISRLFYLINDEFHYKLFKNEDHTNSLFLQILKKLTEQAKRISLTIDNFNKKLKYIKQEIFFDQFYESILNKSFYTNAFKDYTKLLNISYKENQFLFSFILLQEFIKEIISIEMAFIMFDPEPEIKSKHDIKAVDIPNKKMNYENNIQKESSTPIAATSEVLNIIDHALQNNESSLYGEKELMNLKKEMNNLHLDKEFIKELEKEENKEDDDVMKNIEDINDIIMKSIQRNFSDQYLLDLDQDKEEDNDCQSNKADVDVSINYQLSGDTSYSSHRNSEMNISEEIKKLNALFNNSDIANPFDYESFFLENSVTNTNPSMSDISYNLNLRKNSSGSFWYDVDSSDNQYIYHHRKSSLMKGDVNRPSSSVTGIDEIQQEDFNQSLLQKEIDEDNLILSSSETLVKKSNEKELQIPLVSESNTEYYKYLKELPSSPVLPPTLLKTNNDNHSSSSGSLIDPLENEDDLAYLDYLEKLTLDEKHKSKSKNGKIKNKNYNIYNNKDKNKDKNKNKNDNKNKKVDDKDENNNNESNNGSETEKEKDNEEIISCSPTVATITSLDDINNLDINEEDKEIIDDEKQEKGKNKDNDSLKSKNNNNNNNNNSNKKNLKSFLNNKFFSNPKQKINSIFNHKNKIIEPEIINVEDNMNLDLQLNNNNEEDTSKDNIYYDSSYTEFYSETFDESSFLKKNLNTGFGYL
ncbi:hypothetical protein BCR32DRAFT_289197 [Anaeromyces robustus]|uniref:FHF complex subunit HOOK-interacting protein C-terminal domain-containing protein n=1 Tax=Anaeromyces robustus TaxID=1754192 RepID=A0A1Y1XQD0_9FUNG|nr:hypothetical protein BCR32DRAFT_289197 [Anaeromyces robustus]|eukprot:ORX87716.1 hypothetical protein BCR32DRAFT_289197 [Anaeromyces robustus]